MTRNLERVAVIGSGIMGSGIAANCASAGAKVILLDIAAEDPGDRSKYAREAIKRMDQGKLPAISEPSLKSEITAGNLDDDLHLLKECDWVIEAIIEDVWIKRDLYQKIAPYLSDKAILSSNTSSLLRNDLIANLHSSLQSRFLITHFFNPPRYMQLLELVGYEKCNASLVYGVSQFAERSLGKTLVHSNDCPGFIANRLGSMWLMAATVEAKLRGISPNLADAVLSKPFGIPATGVFGLLDLIGIDLMARTVTTMQNALPEEDMMRTYTDTSDLYERMTEKGLKGRRTGAGFYRVTKDHTGNRQTEIIDLSNYTYRLAEVTPDAASDDLADILDTDEDPLSEYAWAVMTRTLVYAVTLIPEVTQSTEAIDQAMRLGYGWQKGPFELIEEIGPGNIVESLMRRRIRVPPLLMRAVDEGTSVQQQANRLRH